MKTRYKSAELNTNGAGYTDLHGKVVKEVAIGLIKDGKIKGNLGEQNA